MRIEIFLIHLRLDIDIPPLTANRHGYRKPIDLLEQLSSFAYMCENYKQSFPLFHTGLLCSKDIVYIRHRQKETFSSLSQDVLWKCRRHRNIQFEENKSYLQTVKEETIPQKCRL